jgi:hypothetical protein
MKGTFRDHLEATRRQAMDALLHKAYLANALAKLSRGSQRSKLYRLKCRYLSEAIELSHADFVCDSMLTSRVRIIRITSARGYRFHVPLSGLSVEARGHFLTDWGGESLDAAA